jgi:hypothetical protein
MARWWRRRADDGAGSVRMPASRWWSSGVGRWRRFERCCAGPAVRSPPMTVNDRDHDENFAALNTSHPGRLSALVAVTEPKEVSA